MSNAQSTNQAKNVSTNKTVADLARENIGTQPAVDNQAEQTTATAQTPAPVETAETTQWSDEKMTLLASWLNITTDELASVIYFIGANRKVLIEKLQAKGLEKTWKFVTKKTNVDLKAKDVLEIIKRGFALMRAQLIAQLEAVNSDLAKAVDAQIEAVVETFLKAHKRNASLSDAITKAVGKVNFMGVKGKDILAQPFVVKAIADADRILTVKPEVKHWEPGSFGRAIRGISAKHAKAK